jgi:hypothetical protein
MTLGAKEAEAVVVLVLVDRLASVAQSPSVASLASRLSSVSGIYLCDIWVRLCPFFSKKRCVEACMWLN